MIHGKEDAVIRQKDLDNQTFATKLSFKHITEINKSNNLLRIYTSIYNMKSHENILFFKLLKPHQVSINRIKHITINEHWQNYNSALPHSWATYKVWSEIIHSKYIDDLNFFISSVCTNSVCYSSLLSPLIQRPLPNDKLAKHTQTDNLRQIVYSPSN